MIPSEIETVARFKYNATGDTFYSATEIYSYIWQACMELAVECDALEKLESDVSVLSQRAYDWPTRAIRIKRITYDGKKLEPINFREDDSITLSNSSTTATGTPQYYSVWDRVYYLRPIPDTAALVIQIFTQSEPVVITTATQVLEVDTTHHLAICDFVVGQMALKDQNIQIAEYYIKKWEDYKNKAKAHQRKMRRGDRMVHVQDVDTLPETILGVT